LNATGVDAGYRGGGTFASVEPPRGQGVFREEGYLTKPLTSAAVLLPSGGTSLDRAEDILTKA
jgi:hypothetical protein